jgi:hypothetical protein
LRKNGTTYTHYVHKLVADAFIPYHDGKDFINHKDGNKLNPHKSNLERVTHSENIKHAYGLKLIDKTHISKEVVNIETGTVYPSAKEASIEASISYSTLKNYLNGGRPNKTTMYYIESA